MRRSTHEREVSLLRLEQAELRHLHKTAAEKYSALLAEITPLREKAAAEKAARTVRVTLTAGNSFDVELPNAEAAEAALIEFATAAGSAHIAVAVLRVGSHVLRVADVARVETPAHPEPRIESVSTITRRHPRW